VAHRNAVCGFRGGFQPSEDEKQRLKDIALSLGQDCLVVEEVSNIIELPEFNHLAVYAEADSIVLPPDVIKQCREYVAQIASMYNNNPFHNFEVSWLLYCFRSLLPRLCIPFFVNDSAHSFVNFLSQHATHVVMSVHKVMDRIVAPKWDEDDGDEDDNIGSDELSEHTEDEFDEDFLAKEEKEHKKHDHTYGITSDPVVQFAIVLSALGHDSECIFVVSTRGSRRVRRSKDWHKYLHPIPTLFRPSQRITVVSPTVHLPRSTSVCPRRISTSPWPSRTAWILHGRR